MWVLNKGLPNKGINELVNPVMVLTVPFHLFLQQWFLLIMWLAQCKQSSNPNPPVTNLYSRSLSGMILSSSCGIIT